MDGTTVAIAVVVVVLIAIAGVVFAQRQAAAARRLSPEQQIGRGVGDLVGGIIGLATAGDSDGGG